MWLDFIFVALHEGSKRPTPAMEGSYCDSGDPERSPNASVDFAVTVASTVVLFPLWGSFGQIFQL